MLKKSNILFLFIVAVVLNVFFESCGNRPEGVLNSRKMEDLLVEMHVLEGTLRASGNYYGSGSDTRQYYDVLFEKYGVSLADFDSSLVWYTKHPKEFERIYVNVMGRIDTLGADVRRGKYHPVDSSARSGEINLWNKATKYVLTKDSARTKLEFKIENIELLPNDLYKLSFLRRGAPSDSSRNPHAVLYVNYAGDVVDSIYTRTPNDSIKRRYTLTFRARKNLPIRSLSGFLLGYDSSSGKMNVTLDSIRLVRKYNPFKQDSIRTVMLRMDSVIVAKDSLKSASKDSVKSAAKDSVKSLSRDTIRLRTPKKGKKLLEVRKLEAPK